MKIMCLLLLLLASSLAAAPLTFSGFLTGSNESPPVNSPGTGFTLVTIDPDAHTLRVQVEFSGLTSGTTASHIHVINGPGDANTADTNGPVATTVPTFPGFPSGVTAGTYDQTLNTLLSGTYNPSFLTAAGGTAAAAEAALFSGITGGRAYLNIHTSNFGGGEIRDFLKPVPEPATFALAGAALCALALVSRSRKASS